MPDNKTPQDELREKPSHIKTARDIIRWVYNHGELKGAYPEKDPIDRTVILDAAESWLQAEKDRLYAEVMGGMPEKYDDSLGEQYWIGHDEAIDQATTAVNKVFQRGGAND